MAPVVSSSATSAYAHASSSVPTIGFIRTYPPRQELAWFWSLPSKKAYPRLDTSKGHNVAVEYLAPTLRIKYERLPDIAPLIWSRQNVVADLSRLVWESCSPRLLPNVQLQK